MPTESRMELCAKLHEGILLTQRKMRHIRLLMPSELSTVESIILSHLAYDPKRTARDLVALLRISKSKISRLLHQLNLRGCLRFQGNTDDGRSKQLEFTEMGQQMLRQADDLNSRISQIGCALLSPREHLRMVDLFRKLNNGLGAPAEKLREGESPFAPQQRRAVIAMGMLGSEYMGTELNLPQYQVLFELHRRSQSPSFAELSQALPLSAAKVSRILSDFEDRGFIGKIIGQEDRRSKKYQLSSSGETLYLRLSKEIEAKIALASESFTNSELVEFIHYLALIDQAPLPELASQGYRLEICRDEPMLQRARAFLVESLVRQGKHKQLDQHLLPDSSFCCLGFWHEDSLAVIEVRIFAGSQAHRKKRVSGNLTHFVVSPRLTSSGLEEKTLLQAVELAFDSGKFECLIFDKEALSSKNIEFLQQQDNLSLRFDKANYRLCLSNP